MTLSYLSRTGSSGKALVGSLVRDGKDDIADWLVATERSAAFQRRLKKGYTESDVDLQTIDGV